MKIEKTIQKLSAAFIKTDHSDVDKRYEIYDTVVNGFILRITKTGYKSFAYRYWYDGQSRQITIGRADQISLADARKKAREFREVVREGKDPQRQRQQERESKPLTLGEYIEQFKSDYVKRKLKATTRKTYKSRLNKITDSSISDLLLKDVNRKDVRKFLKNEAKKYPTNANRLHSIISKVFNEAIEDGILSENPIKGMSKISEERRRDPQYSSDDIKAIWEAINEEWEPIQGILKMLLITGQRLGETKKMKWADIQDDFWIIPISDQKTGKRTKRNHKVPLSYLALDVLDQMKPINGSSEYVFASLKDQEKVITHFKGAIDRIREKAELEDFVIHDLRHIVATQMIELGVEFTTVGKVLNHKALAGENAITARYINTDLTKHKTTALSKWANELNRLATGEQAEIHKIA